MKEYTAASLQVMHHKVISVHDRQTTLYSLPNTCLHPSTCGTLSGMALGKNDTGENGTRMIRKNKHRYTEIMSLYIIFK